MGGGRRADAAGAVGRRRGERDARRRDQRLRDRMVGRAQRQRLEPGAREQAHLAARRDRRDDRQRPRPERLGEPAGEIVERALARRGRRVGDMGDQRIERRPALGGVDRGDGAVVGRVGGEAVDRLGRHRDEAAGVEARGGFGDRLRIGGREAGLTLGLRHACVACGDRLARVLVYI